MLLKITRFVSLSLMGLGTGVSFSHLLQWAEGRAAGRGVREGSEDPLQRLRPNRCHHGTRGATLHPGGAGPTPQAPHPGACPQTLKCEGTLIRE